MKWKKLDQEGALVPSAPTHLGSANELIVNIRNKDHGPVMTICNKEIDCDPAGNFHQIELLPSKV